MNNCIQSCLRWVGDLRQYSRTVKLEDIMTNTLQILSLCCCSRLHLCVQAAYRDQDRRLCYLLS